MGHAWCAVRCRVRGAAAGLTVMDCARLQTYHRYKHRGAFVGLSRNAHRPASEMGLRYMCSMYIRVWAEGAISLASLRSHLWKSEHDVMCAKPDIHYSADLCDICV